MPPREALAQEPRPPTPATTGDARKPYIPPAVEHELTLETRAGSPVGMLNPFDPRPKI